MKDIYRWVFQIPLSDVQNEIMPKLQGDKPCILCGKQHTNVRYYVNYLRNSDSLVSTPEEFEDSEAFPVGTGCARKKLPNNFYFTDKD